MISQEYNIRGGIFISTIEKPSTQTLWGGVLWTLDKNTVTNGKNTFSLEEGTYTKLVPIGATLLIVDGIQAKYRIAETSIGYELFSLVPVTKEFILGDMIKDFTSSVVSMLRTKKLYHGISTNPVEISVGKDGEILLKEETEIHKIPVFMNNSFNFSITESEGVIWINEVPIVVGI